MKKLLLIALVALPFAAKAQTTTNIAYRIQVETVTAGATNTVTTNFRWDWGVNSNDGLKISGLSYAFNQYRSSGGNKDFGAWLKQDTNDRAKDYQNAQQIVLNQLLVQKLTALLLQNPDLLSAGDLTSLNTIASKAP